ncbi:hypothetical protein JJL45_03380 [Tamlana sp. s12]|uniref:hypothetical protein n=1 Tax=Tamlana sp. s12 TaxID=1630406 RepID=UPI0007FCC987|nr:hypothetical protein [Tamlana sp. s12]OBQ54943.1 hypothetical protein VQ01_09355 [Tamlana sp. s12]QQY83050.1 hypothetical protein JJL45_03380 [Tamlana sp. s12]
MEVEKDLIKREIQRLTLMLSGLVEKISGLNPNSAKGDIDEVNNALKSQFDLSLEDIAEMSASDVIKKISNLHESHIEKIVELIHEIILKIESSDVDLKFEKTKIAEKGIIIIDFLNENSNTFSMKRMHIKTALQNRL